MFTLYYAIKMKFFALTSLDLFSFTSDFTMWLLNEYEPLL